MSLAEPNTVKPMKLVSRRHDALHTPAMDVRDWDAALDLARRMQATLDRQDGAALAAAQVGHPLNLIVTDRRLDGKAWANIRITGLRGEVLRRAEGCLTMPGRWFMVPRNTIVTVQAVDVETRKDETFTVADDFVARMWQHEFDHVAGRLLIDRYEEVRHHRG